MYKFLALATVLMVCTVANAKPSRIVFPTDPPCSGVNCRMYCPFGFETDSNGCEICRCRTECPPVCRIYCPNGNVKDAYGCDTCKCKPF
ncbi:antistasin-like [Hydractinia symbiolongicarpus]|uniref:antistasin-like n=1 Tax=Hydractinia symbiolongicarpus TaxID=13093 RepID=UPI002550584B|nr:antistasin-like [Hydractinia symbiolongicarpus]